MIDVPDSADSYTRLRRAGWSIGSTAFDGPAGRSRDGACRRGFSASVGACGVLPWRRPKRFLPLWYTFGQVLRAALPPLAGTRNLCSARDLQGG
jgi:hypothetical protein